MTALAQAHHHHRNGNRVAAESGYRAALADDPGDGDALHWLGALCLEDGRHATAERLLARSVRVAPGADAFFHRALLLELQGCAGAAPAVYRRALAIDPAFAEALGNLGAVLMSLRTAGQGEAMAGRAADLHRRALRLQPLNVAALSNLGAEHRDRGRPQAALAAFRAALAVRPDHPDLLFNLTLVLEALRRPHETIVVGRRALALRPDHADVLCAVAEARRELGALAESTEASARVLALRPDYPEALVNLANTLQEQGILDAAEAAYRRALRLRPGFADAHWNLGLLDLLQGRYATGWRGYEWRWRLPGFQHDAARFRQPWWTGEEGGGRTMLLHTEQGLGDAIQFVRFVPAVVARGWRVVLEVPPALMELFAALPGVILAPRGRELPPFDVHCPLLSLPGIVATTRDTIPAAVPYLAVPPERVAAWRARMPAGGVRVGIVWQGNPQFPGDRRRSVPLEWLAPLAWVPGVRLVSLQKNHGLDQLDRLSASLAAPSLGPGFDTLADTAAAMAALDLIVTSDTGLAHLAGALGRPVWVALQAVPDWRWGLNGEDCPWYPTMRLFRQTTPGDWAPVFARITAALANRAATADPATPRPA